MASVAWMSVSSALILLNKDLLSHGFPFPMALSGLGMAFSGTASYLACRVFKLVDAKKTVTPRFYVLRILPVGLFMALTLHFGNLVYLYLTVAFIQMLKVGCAGGGVGAGACVLRCVCGGGGGRGDEGWKE